METANKIAELEEAISTIATFRHLMYKLYWLMLKTDVSPDSDEMRKLHRLITSSEAVWELTETYLVLLKAKEASNSIYEMIG